MATATYLIRDASDAETTIEAESMMDARAEAEEWVREGEHVLWTPSGGYLSAGTIWRNAHIIPMGEDGRPDLDARELLTVQIDPDEPPCSDERGHDWCQQDVTGHGGGVVVREQCKHCELQRWTDTWAQRPDTGEQGLTSVSYERDEREEE